MKPQHTINELWYFVIVSILLLGGLRLPFVIAQNTEYENKLIVEDMVDKTYQIYQDKTKNTHITINSVVCTVETTINQTDTTQYPKSIITQIVCQINSDIKYERKLYITDTKNILGIKVLNGIVDKLHISINKEEWKELIAINYTKGKISSSSYSIIRKTQ
jgi:hypothetical protein